MILPILESPESLSLSKYHVSFKIANQTRKLCELRDATISLDKDKNTYVIIRLDSERQITDPPLLVA